jgi:hypothetical protein
MSHKSSEAMFLRFPAELRRWIAEEAQHGRRSMNAVIVDAVEQLKAVRAGRLAEDNHAAAIERTISAARLPKGTAIMLQTEHEHMRTDILVRRPFQADFSVLACVRGGEVVFADDFVMPVAESGA